MAFGRRFPLYVRPWAAALAILAILVGLAYGPHWDWDWALQTGNIFLVITIPRTIIDFSGLHGVFLVVLVLGTAGFVVFGRAPKNVAVLAAARHDTGLWAPRLRFYPLVLLLGLFLLYFGTLFLFKASVSGAEGAQGLAAFIYLNYDGIFNRGIISLFGVAILGAGLFLTVFGTVQPGLGFDVRPLPEIVAQEPLVPPRIPEPVAPSPRSMATPTALARRPASAGPTGAPITTASGTLRPAPSASRPSSASRPVRSPASRAPPAHTATTPKRPSTASSRPAAGTVRP